ncbi:NusA antitermination factor [Caldithrix abyssi DSM 13497]|uniref:Transcription termination/antitermination protein NusA n=1 Tax=Caldithrix abyssi DSM 13497 TaxID=880073 RepID=H1XXN0_CALAY|nr:transcription termination factor NusA [Caldithrix abyssi]APF19243.1 nusA NusA antitermination factor [Caldithrix abyssi DSM 13497]EHO43154.1 NusA antitermination factor [Caldithrix abyssi DSM 13497]
MNVEIMEAITQIAKDKRIDKDHLRDILESIFLGMIEKRFGTTENFDVIVNIDKGDIEIYQEKTVVEEVTDPVSEIDLESARKIDPDVEIGEEIVEVIDPQLFGRRLIASAKQNLAQKIRDFEREHVIEEYKNRIGEIIIGDIHQINSRGIYINQDKTEVFLPRSEKIPSEILRRGQTVRCLIKEVIEDQKKGRGPEIIVSRADKRFLIRLFELEVPEIYDGIVEIKAVARDPGERAKIAVESIDRRIDAVGACVGMKGVRIQAVVRELNGEKIDIINYSSEPEIFISRALTPAKPIKVVVNEDEKMAVAVIRDDEISLAIGKGGQNLKLASELTGYQIEPLRESEYEKETTVDENVSVEDLHGIPEGIKRKLIDADILYAHEILEQGKENLVKISGIGEKSAEKIIQIAKQYVETTDESSDVENEEEES